MTRREREVKREKSLDAALLVAWVIFVLVVLLH